MSQGELTSIAAFIGTVVGVAGSLLIGRLMIDPAIRRIEAKLELLLDILVNGKPLVP